MLNNRDLEIWVRGRSVKVIQTGTIWKHECGFLFAFHSNYGRISNRLWDIQHQIVQTRCDHTRCLYGSAPQYLAACFIPVPTTASRQHLRSAAGHQLVITSHRLTTYGHQAFSVAGPMFWNSLPRNLRDPSHTAAVFGRSLKPFLFSEY